MRVRNGLAGSEIHVLACSTRYYASNTCFANANSTIRYSYTLRPRHLCYTQLQYITACKSASLVAQSSGAGARQHTCWPLSSKAVVPVLSNTLVLCCKTLAYAACMHALTANHQTCLLEQHER